MLSFAGNFYTGPRKVFIILEGSRLKGPIPYCYQVNPTFQQDHAYMHERST